MKRLQYVTEERCLKNTYQQKTVAQHNMLITMSFKIAILV